MIVWVGVSVVVRLAVDFALGPESDSGFPWRFVPGGLLGMWAGVHLFRIVAGLPQNKDAK